jgi:aldehyde dehydrogenase (NAD+)
MSTTVAAPSFTHPGHLFIGGHWKAPSAGGLIDVTAPFNEQVFASVGEASEVDIDLAVASARRAFDEGPWPRLHPTQRAAHLLDMATHMERRAPEFAAAYTNQVGMPHHIAVMAFAGAVAMVRYFASLAETFPFEDQRPSPQGGIAMVVREPVGVAVCIAPWNAPLHTMLLKVVPALLAGCAVIAKPSPETPLDALILAECAEAASIPEGVFSVLTAGRGASDYLMRHDDVDKVSFTGSTSVGKHIAGVCGARMARFTMELGGKSAAIVLDDADAATTSTFVSLGCMAYSGQACAALTRVLVPRARYGEFIDSLSAAIGRLKVGDPRDPATIIGPLVAERQLRRVEDYIAAGVAEGARIALGGGRPPEWPDGWYIQPTLFADVDNGMKIAREEIFGPVLCAIPYDTEEDAIAIANDNPYGLSGAVFGADLDRVERVARRLRTGSVGLNAIAGDVGLPFGGFKASGIGREFSDETFDHFTETKVLSRNDAASFGALKLA